MHAESSLIYVFSMISFTIICRIYQATIKKTTFENRIFIGSVV